MVFAKRTLKCTQCGWAGGIEAELTRCPKCASELIPTEIFGNQEAAFPLDADSRFVETRAGFWDHDHCLICDVAIGRDVCRSDSCVAPNGVMMRAVWVDLLNPRDGEPDWLTVCRRPLD